MSVAVRYFSRSGNTKAVADAIAQAAGVSAVSVDAPDAAVKEETDVLFVGGALYAYGIDKNLKKYLVSLDAGKTKKAVVFSTSALSKHSVDLIKKGLSQKGIPVESDFFYAKSKPGKAQLDQAAQFAKKYI